MLKQGMELLTDERARQVSDEGYTPENDAKYTNGELLAAGDCYFHRGLYPELDGTPTTWPWAEESWKPKDAKANFLRAGALALAELGRLTLVPDSERDHEWGHRRAAAIHLRDEAARHIDSILIAARQPISLDEMIRQIIKPPMIPCPNDRETEGCPECGRTNHPGQHYTTGGFRTEASLMVRNSDGLMYVVKDVEVEHHDPEESVGGTTCWLTIEEY